MCSQKNICSLIYMWISLVWQELMLCQNCSKTTIITNLFTFSLQLRQALHKNALNVPDILQNPAQAHPNRSLSLYKWRGDWKFDKKSIYLLLFCLSLGKVRGTGSVAIVTLFWDTSLQPRCSKCALNFTALILKSLAISDGSVLNSSAYRVSTKT